MPDETSAAPVITTSELYEATGLAPSTNGDHSRLFGEVTGAFLARSTAQGESRDLLQENAKLAGGLTPSELKARGLADDAAIAQRIQHNKAAITFIYREVMAMTAEPGVSRATAAMSFDNSTPPTAAELETFFMLRDPWDSSKPWPESLEQYSEALGLKGATKERILEEISQRTRERRQRIERRYAKETAELINLTAARVFTLNATQRQGKITVGRMVLLGASLSPSVQALEKLTGKSLTAPVAPQFKPLSVLPTSRVKSFGMGTPLLLSADFLTR